MSVSVDLPTFGHLDIPASASSTAADILLLLRHRLPDVPWHGNQVLSCGLCQLQGDDAIEATSKHSHLVLANYSEVSNKETRDMCNFPSGRRLEVLNSQTKVETDDQQIS